MHPFAAIEYLLSRFAAKRGWAVLAILVIALAARLAVLRTEPIPAPGVHDEFSYLLMGDTFAHGRLTNPTHVMWVHFESMAINQQPTYCSAFYPAQGAFLALGQVVFGHPFWGVWLSTGLMCAAICWALQGWMPPAWGFLGGILAILRFGVFSYWADSYWGGSVAAIGGALVLGALPRIKRHLRARDALLMALGFTILANSRPYESLFYSAPFFVALAVFIFGKKSPPFSLTFRRLFLPLAAVMVLTLAFMAYYFWRTTGNPLRPPYLINVSTYMQDPQFLWSAQRAPLEYHDFEMAKFYRIYHIQQAIAAQQQPLVALLRRSFQFWAFFVGLTLTIPFFVLVGILPYGLKFRNLGNTRFLLLLWLVSFIALLLPVPSFPHYAAPMTCVTLAIVMQALRRVRIWDSNGGNKGLWTVRAVIAITVFGFVFVTLRMPHGDSREKSLRFGLLVNTAFRFDLMPHNQRRAELVKQLSQTSGNYLIVVHYGTDHNPHEEWVYNDADIDGSKIVWARELGPEENKRLLHYFKGREIFLLDPDDSPPTLLPYSPQAVALASAPNKTTKDNLK